jgi:hypothetical protein
MRTTQLACLVVAACFVACVHSVARDRRPSERPAKQASTFRSVPPPARPQTNSEQTPSSDGTLGVSQITERVFKRESEEEEIIASYTPIVQTYIQLQKSDPLMGTVPKSDLYFLGIADYHKARIHVRSMTQSTHTGNIKWSFEPAGFLQMAFADYGDFNQDNYRLLLPAESGRREFLGEVRCYVFDVLPMPRARGSRFLGRIWVEDQDFTIVRANGVYTPERRLTLRNGNEFAEHFDSWRSNVRPGVWLPSDIYTQDMREPPPTGGPRFKARTQFWGYGLALQNRQEELGRLIVESQGQIKDESDKQDRSPLEQQRGWRDLAERNVLDVLERSGLVAPKGDVEKVLDTVVNNIMVTNNFDRGLEFHCRVLLTSDFELFSMQKSIVISRGLLDVVPNEETLAVLLAFEMADALLPKPAHDQYGFSDILRLTPTEALKKLSFVDTPEEARQNSEKAVAWLRKSPYADKLANAGLFLAQLQSQRKALKELINARLGNEVYFTSQLLQAAPALEPANLRQIGALPLGSRIKINVWNDSLSLIKAQQLSPLSPREKMPFEVTPIDLYLTRFIESANDGEHSIVPKSAFPVASTTGKD